ncbi:hypothetical protein HYV49_00205 [Candidatus Pacearchaeota archaeon]|nr:hypothetical protein [Candidatus Pacearchaeota archaeon]
MVKPYTPNIERMATRLNVDENIAFAYPYSKRSNYKSVAQEILNNKTAGLSLPDGEKTSYLLKAVYCGPEDFQKQPESVELREIMKSGYFWLFQRNLWIPEKYKSSHGVFVVYDEKGIGTSEELDIGELEKALKGGRELKNGIKFSEDDKIGFAPRDTYNEGEMSPEDFANDGFIIVSNKEQGARNLAGVSQSRHFKNKKPRSWIVNPDKELIQTVSAVGYGRYWVDYRLDFGGCHDDFRFGFASGVLVSGEARAN